MVFELSRKFLRAIGLLFTGLNLFVLMKIWDRGAVRIVEPCRWILGLEILMLVYIIFLFFKDISKGDK